MWQEMIDLQSIALLETLYMVAISGALACLIGIPLGVLLTVTSKGHLLSCPPFYRIMGMIVNAARSVPFIILMVAIIPLTRLLAGTSIGTEAAIVPLTLAAAPFVADAGAACGARSAGARSGAGDGGAGVGPAADHRQQHAGGRGQCGNLLSGPPLARQPDQL